MDVEKQKDFISKELQRPLIKGDIWYMVDEKWVKQWKSYVGYESWDHYNVGEESANPGPIDNTPLFEDSTTKLKEHLIDDLDYYLMPSPAWDKLLEWYGIANDQEPLSRKMIEEGVYSKSLKVEVYRWHLNICENSNPDVQVRKQYSRADTVEYLEKTMRKEFNIPGNKEVRMWKRYLTNMYQPLKRKNESIQDAGLYQGQVVVIEVQNEDGTWPSSTSKPCQQHHPHHPRRHLETVPPLKRPNGSRTKQKISVKFKNSGSRKEEPSRDDGNVSGRSSNITVVPGLCGLSEIGNSSFVNSVLQCLSNVPELTEYFLSDRWSVEINENSRFGTSGEIARTYGELVKILWSGKYSHTAPSNFKGAIEKYSFSGTKLQTPKEIVSFLLDALHEDLNRVKTKPEQQEKRPDELSDQETWDNFKKENNSVIVELFHGMLKVSEECPNFEWKTETFNTFCIISLPVPSKITPKRQMEVVWIPKNSSKRAIKFGLIVSKTGCVNDLCQVLSTYVHVKKEHMKVTDVYNHRFHKLFDSDAPLSQIMDRDDIYVYEVPITSSDDVDTVVLPVYTRAQSGGEKYQLFGQPILLAVSKQNCTYKQLYDSILDRLSRFVNVRPHDHSGEETVVAGIQRLFKITVVNSYGSAVLEHKLLDDGSVLELDSQMHVSLDWNTEVKHQFYNDEEADSYETHSSLNDKPPKVAKDNVSIPITECLKSFSATHVGQKDHWYCPQCKMHQQPSTRVDIWSVPDVLVIDLERMKDAGDQDSPDDVLVEFPMRLDMKNYIGNSSKGSPELYDLIGTINLTKGKKYSSFCKHRELKKWYCFDNEKVTDMNDEQIVTNNANMLFYRKCNDS